VEYLEGLGTDLRAAVVLDARERLAAHSGGDPERGRRMRDLSVELFERAEAAAGERVDQLEVSIPSGSVYAVRRPSFSIAVVAGRLALSSLVLFDLRRVLAELDAARAR
jgi:hypothetical protein